MRTVVFSDVHGNLPALKAMLAHAGPVDRYVCLGDVVNYGPWGNECVRCIAQLPRCTRVMGNHDQAFLDGYYAGGNAVAQAFFAFCMPKFDQHALLRSYVDSCTVGGFHARHTIQERYIFPDTEVVLDRNYLIGHSHHQFMIEKGGYRLFNAGSVGQNRDDLRVCHYLVCGPGPSEVRMAGCTYDFVAVLRAMEQQSYPPICLQYYHSKIRSGPVVLPA